MVLGKGELICDLCNAGLETVGVRMPNHPVALMLIAQCGFPLAAPSANRFGKISPTSASDVIQELGGKIEAVLDGGPCQIGVESTVLRFDQKGAHEILRPGGTTKAQLEGFLGRSLKEKNPRNLPRAMREMSASFASPGQLSSHYAPTKKLFLAPRPFKDMTEKEWAHLSGICKKYGEGKFQARAPTQPVAITNMAVLFLTPHPQELLYKLHQHLQKVSEVAILSENGSAAEVAQRLFSELRRLDASPCDILVAEPFHSSEGLGYAINDRLTRASASYS